MQDHLLYYNIGAGVEAFSTMVSAVLPYPVLQMHQVHGDRIAVITDRKTTREDLRGYDAMITDIPGLAIGARSADCIPVLLFDPVHQAIAAIHSGWRGTVQRISQKTMLRMHEVYGTLPGDLHAVIGPGISAEAFQVGQEVVDAFVQAAFPMERIYTWRGENDHTLRSGHHLDLWEANRWLLGQSGVQPNRIRVAGICTYFDTRFYSARREKDNKCLRIINSIKLNI